MPESGGVTTQSGIYYQNSIAALYLGRLLDTRPRQAFDRVVEVRVEAPEYVDDIVVRHADGGCSYIQAKEKLVTTGNEWCKLWNSFLKQQTEAIKTGERFALCLIVSRYSNEIGSLIEVCERAHGKNSLDEWKGCLSKQQLGVLGKINSVMTGISPETIFEVLRHTEISVWPLDRIEADFTPLFIPFSNRDTITLYRTLRDMVGGHARIRASFRSTDIIDRLLSEFRITIDDAQHWGTDVYRQTIIASMGTLSVAGTALQGPIQEIFMWPQLREQSIGQMHRDFEEEDLRWRWSHPAEVVDLKSFPRGICRRAVINAGAGFGKTTLLHALACKLSKDPIFVPAVIQLDNLVSKKITVVDYLNGNINGEYGVNIDWEYLCDHGRAILFFDGLDELTDQGRISSLNLIVKFGGRFPDVPFLITVRDSSALSVPLGASILEIIRMDDGMIEEFARAYKKVGAKIDGKDLLRHAHRHPDLGNLLRIPLFLALLLATKLPVDDLPRNRSDLLEHYLSLFFSPERFKDFDELPEPIDDLMDAVQLLAFRGLEHDSIGLPELEAKKILRSATLLAKPGKYLDRLYQIVAIRRSGTRIHFVYPIVQEYLAACWLVENAPGEVAERFNSVVRRPWAQAIQFALEKHPESDKVIRNQLDKPDDVFSTVLRLVARCVVNGAKIEPDLHSKLGTRLVSAWGSESYSIRQSIGYLLADGFCDPLPENAYNIIYQGWALQNGGAEILVAKSDPELTKMVLVKFLEKDLTYQYRLNDWQIAVDMIASQALELYLGRIRAEFTNSKEIEALMSLIYELPAASISQNCWNNIASDMALPSEVRLVAYVRSNANEQDKAWTLMEEILNPFCDRDNVSGRFPFVVNKLFWCLEDADKHFIAFLIKPNLMVSQKCVMPLAEKFDWRS
jgi:hypothetical protein